MAATNINVVVVSGNLTHDPELRETGTGHSVAELKVANNVPFKKDGEWTSKANFFQVNAWGKLGETCEKYLEKGSPVTVKGRLDWQMWETKEGKTNSRVVIVAEDVQFGRKSPDQTTKSADVGKAPDDIPF